MVESSFGTFRFIRTILVLVLLLVAPASAEAPARSLFPAPHPRHGLVVNLPSVDTLIEQAQIGKNLGFVLADAKTRSVLKVLNPSKIMPPASVTKIITGAYALDKLGNNHKFVTKVYAIGTITSGVVNGDLVILGGGDPTLNTDALVDMVTQVRELGVKKVTGRLRYYTGALTNFKEIDRSQPPHLWYNPSISGLNLNSNRVHFEWSKKANGYATSMAAPGKHGRVEVSSSKMRIINRSDPIFLYKKVDDLDEWSVASDALGRKGARWLPVRRPGLYAAEAFQAIARKQGLVLTDPAPIDLEDINFKSAALLAQHESMPLTALVKNMLKHSNNLYAEVLGLAASEKAGLKTNSLRDSGRNMEKWAKDKFAIRDVSFRNHSGLSDKTKISAGAMVQILTHLLPDNTIAPLLSEVTLRRDVEELSTRPYLIRAKTGSLNFVSALAGYITLENQRELVFAIFTADLSKRKGLSRALRERPPGAKKWANGSRKFQHQLLSRWAAIYGQADHK